MGTWSTYRCNKCNYEVRTSGGHDYGMRIVTDTYICRPCQKIVDVCVGENGITYSQKEVLQMKKVKPSIDLNLYACPECGTERHLLKWSNKLRPCPRCEGQMGKVKDAGIVYWD